MVRAGNFKWSSSGSSKGTNWEARHNLSCNISFTWLIVGGLEESKSDSEAAAASWIMLCLADIPNTYIGHQGVLVDRAASSAGCTQVETVNRTKGNGFNMEE